MKKAIFASERTFRDGWEIGPSAVWGHLCELTETPYISPNENRVKASVTAESLSRNERGSQDNITLQAVFDTTGTKISFSANGDFYISGLRYTKKLNLRVYYNENSNIKSISIS